MEQNAERKRMENKLSLGNIITMIVLIASMCLAYGALDARVGQQVAEIDRLRTYYVTVTQETAAMRERLAGIEARLTGIESGVARLLARSE